MYSLPYECIFHILQYLDIKDIISFIKSDEKYSFIIDDEYFWECKLKGKKKYDDFSWKESYLNKKYRILFLNETKSYRFCKSWKKNERMFICLPSCKLILHPISYGGFTKDFTYFDEE